MNKKLIYNIVLCGLFVVAVILMSLSSIYAVLLPVAFGFMFVSLLGFTVIVIQNYIKSNKETRNRELEELLYNQENSQFDEVEIEESNKRKGRNNSKIGYIVILAVAVIVCAYMFIHLLV